MKKNLLIGAILIAVITGIFFIKPSTYINLATIQQHATTMYTWTHAHITLAIFLYMAIMFLITFLYIPAAVILSVTGGFLFGPIRGTVYAISGVTLGSMLMFILVRYYFGNYVQRRYAHLLKKLNAEADTYGDYYLLMLQLFPFTPTFVINTCAGLTKISLWTFGWTTYIGMIPGTFIYAFAGSKLHTIKSLRDIVSWDLITLLIMMSALAVLPIVLKRRA